MMKYFAIIVLALMHGMVNAQDDWKLREEKDGMSVYTRTFPDSKFKAIKVEITLDARLGQVVALLMDANAGSEWLYATKASTLLKQISPSELYYYCEVKLPWPTSDRDFVARMVASQDRATKIVTIDAPVVTGYMPEKKGIVRVKKGNGRWVLMPLGRGRVRVVYTLQTDPGGDLPAWLFNLFVTRGPEESFEKLKEQVKKPKYEQAKLRFITD